MVSNVPDIYVCEYFVHEQIKVKSQLNWHMILTRLQPLSFSWTPYTSRETSILKATNKVKSNITAT
jgi:hypothetical protein